MIKFKENLIYFTPAEIPFINIYCLISLQSWKNLKMIALEKDKKVFSMLDIQLSILAIYLLSIYIFLLLNFFDASLINFGSQIFFTLWIESIMVSIVVKILIIFIK